MKFKRIFLVKMSILCSCVASSLPPGFELRVIVNKLVELKKNLKNLEKEIFPFKWIVRISLRLHLVSWLQFKLQTIETELIYDWVLCLERIGHLMEYFILEKVILYRIFYIRVARLIRTTFFVIIKD